MLDTRNIEIFCKPQTFIDQVNPLLFDRTLSKWNDSSVNLVVSDLLWNHIHDAIQTKETFNKILETANKVGFKAGTQLLICHSSGILFFIEVLSVKTVRIVLGAVNNKAQFLFTMAGDVELFPDGKDGVWYQSVHPILSDRYNYLDQEKLEEFSRKVLTKSVATYVWLSLIEVETKLIQPKDKFKAKKYEGFKNMQKVPIRVADLNWSYETVRDLPYGVSGHLRNQPVGPGRVHRKLVYIEPYLKQGLHRKSGKERILKTK